MSARDHTTAGACYDFRYVSIIAARILRAILQIVEDLFVTGGMAGRFKYMKPIAFLLILLFSVSSAAQTVSLGPVSKLDFCTGQSLTVPYTFNGHFESDNVFAIQLSDSKGSFNSFTVIGEDPDSIGNIVATFSYSGDHYRIRVISSDPYVVSSDNGNDISVSAPPTPDVQYISWTGDQFSLKYSWAVGLAGDTLNLMDVEQRSLSYQWHFDQDGTPVTASNNASVGVVYSKQGKKTGTLTAIASPGCSTTTAFSYYLFDCNPIITPKAHVVTGIETGKFDSVWIKPGAQYTDNYGAIAFVETGGSLVANHNGVGLFFVKRGGSVTFAQQDANPIIVEDSGVILNAPPNTEGIYHCNSLQFEPAQRAGVDVPHQEPIVSIQHKKNGLEITSVGSIDVQLFNLLGKHVMSTHGESELSVDASRLPAGMYLARITAGSDAVVQRVMVIR